MPTLNIIEALLENRRTFLVFAGVGAATAALYFSSLALQIEVLSIDYRVAVTISYLLGNVFQFSVNKLLTFKNKDLPGTLPQLFRYAAVAAFNYVLTMLIVLFVVEVLRQPPYLGVIFSIGVTMIAGYLLSKHWIFANRERGE